MSTPVTKVVASVNIIISTHILRNGIIQRAMRTAMDVAPLWIAT